MGSRSLSSDYPLMFLLLGLTIDDNKVTAEEETPIAFFSKADYSNCLPRCSFVEYTHF